MAVEKFVFTFNSRIDNIRVMRASLKNFLKLKKISDADIFDTELAVNEALANVIEHTYKYVKEEMIILKLFWDDDERSCVFEIQDRGKPVDKNRIRSRELDDLQDHGLGIYLMQNIMDEVEFRSIKNGNILYMKKKYEEEG
ncbi:MAG TPA: ATP-binding protein [Thermotogota bacterium]|nr:ATP-binding protein [Thermotogota bacterium]HPJ89100.1 ATP-binding protein [Thermotogota bacterium]HPR96127.1 ATP-binding protein [Thermotogota bacterium]